MKDWQSTYLGRGALPRDLSGFEIETFFAYSESERHLIDDERRTPALKLALALQIGFLRMTGRLLEAVSIQAERRASGAGCEGSSRTCGDASRNCLNPKGVMAIKLEAAPATKIPYGFLRQSCPLEFTGAAKCPPLGGLSGLSPATPTDG